MMIIVIENIKSKKLTESLRIEGLKVWERLMYK